MVGMLGCGRGPGGFGYKSTVNIHVEIIHFVLSAAPHPYRHHRVMVIVSQSPLPTFPFSQQHLSEQLLFRPATTFACTNNRSLYLFSFLYSTIPLYKYLSFYSNAV